MSPNQQVVMREAQNTSIHGKLIIAMVFLLAIGAFHLFDLTAYRLMSSSAISL
jgi:hypothetical protein